MLTLAQVKAKSEKRLDGLHVTVRQNAERLIELAYKSGVPIVIVQGLRTVAEQNALYAQGRTKPGPKVTMVLGGNSKHNYGLAIDFALLLPDGRSVSWDTYRDGDRDSRRDWLEVADIGKALGFEWGGDWDTFIDMPHFEMCFGLTIAQLKAGKRPPVQMPLPTLPGVKKVNIKVEGRKVAEGEVRAGVTWVPIRVVTEALGATLEYDKEKGVNLIPKGDK